MDSEFKIEGKGIDAASLEAELARRVEERRRAGIYSPEIEAKLNERLPEEDDEYGRLPPIAELDYSATRALSGWAVTAAYPVTTEKRFIRPFVLFAKRIARFWARIAVGPIQREQSAFNRHAAHAIDAVRQEALQERAMALAAEKDLCLLIDALIDDDTSRDITASCIAGLGPQSRLAVIGPCPEGLAKRLEENGYKLFHVSPGLSWEATISGGVQSGPLSFLSQIPEESLEAILIPELAFWLRPEALISLIRRAYLVLAPGGRAAVAVHGFAAGAPAPSWCSPVVVEKALLLAGFQEISMLGGSMEDATAVPTTGYVAVALKQ